VRRAGVLIAMLIVGLGVDAHSQTLSLGLSSGGFFPKDKTYRDIYGVSLPLEFEARLGLFENFGLAAGVSHIRSGGDAVNVNKGQDRYPVRFRMTSFPLSSYFLFPLGGVTLLGGAGLSVHSYQETWQDLELRHKGKVTRPFVYAGAEHRFLPRLAARLALRYETVNAGRNPFLADEIDLGGLTLLVGVSVRVF
jgi:hypothetical protein